MLGLNENSPFEMLRQFAVHLNADLQEDFGAARLILDNEKGKGGIRLYEIFPGLTAWVYDINFNSDFTIVLKFSEGRPYYFGYHISGYQMQKFQNEEESRKIEQGQNFTLVGESGNQIRIYYTC